MRVSRLTPIAARSTLVRMSSCMYVSASHRSCGSRPRVYPRSPPRRPAWLPSARALDGARIRGPLSHEASVQILDVADILKPVGELVRLVAEERDPAVPGQRLPDPIPQGSRNSL